MDKTQLLKLEALRDRAQARRSKAARELAELQREWGRQAAEPVKALERQLQAVVDGWQQAGEWAAQRIRADAEREMM